MKKCDTAKFLFSTTSTSTNSSLWRIMNSYAIRPNSPETTSMALVYPPLQSALAKSAQPGVGWNTMIGLS